MGKQLFEYAIILQEKANKDGDVKEESQLLDRGEVLARNQQDATLLAGRKIPEAHLEHLERVTLAVRPF